jgi:hypothetical protein
MTSAAPTPVASISDPVTQAAVSTGADAGPEQVKDRTAVIRRDVPAANTRLGERYTVQHTQVDRYSQGEVVTLDGLDDRQVQRLLKLGAIKVATAEEIKAADTAEADADVNGETDDSEE